MIRGFAMNIIKEYSSILIATLGGGLAWMFGGLDMALLVLLVVICLDYITGIMAGYVEKRLSSRYGYKGILKKVGIIIAVALACLADKVIGTDNVLRMAIIFCFIGNEGISILENLSRIGVPVPKKLMDALLQLKGSGDNESK